MRDKIHWYDGKFYDKLIAPNQDKMFYVIKSIIENGSSVIDIGCGTGRLGFFLADKCSHYTGIDLSSKNINTASAIWEKRKIPNIKFIHGSAENLDTGEKSKYDYAVLTYMLHEMPPDERNNVIKEARRAASKLIMGDYLVPRPAGFWSHLNTAVEFMAGSDHFKNFKIFVNSGGLKGLAEENSLRILKEIKNKPLTSHIIVAY